MNIKEIVLESKEYYEKFYNLGEWKKAARKHGLKVTVSGMAGALHRAAKIYYAIRPNGGGTFNLYSPNNGDGHISVDMSD